MSVMRKWGLITRKDGNIISCTFDNKDTALAATRCTIPCSRVVLVDVKQIDQFVVRITRV